MSTAPGQSNPYRKLVEKAFAESMPLSCQFEITYRCNHLCTFCYNSPNGEREMTTEQIFEALRKISEFGVLYVTLTGGDPFCHKDFFKIAREVRRLGMALRIYTNGYLLANPEMVRKVKALTPFEVEVSIHGEKAETHDELTRIRGSFEKTVAGVRNLVEAGIKVNLKCPITRLNQRELFGVRDLGEELGCRVTFDAVITPKDDGNLDPLALRPDDEFLQKYWSEWYAELHHGQLPPKSNHCEGGDNANCGAGRSGFTIDPYGNLLPCVALRRTAANVLKIDKIEDIWRSSSVLHEVRQLTVEARRRLDEHENGPYFTFCLGTAETQTGDPLALYPQAEINARAVRRHYDLMQIETPAESKDSA